MRASCFSLFLFPLFLFGNWSSLLQQPTVNHALVGIYVWDVKDKKSLIEHNAASLFVPSSVTKIPIAIGAYELLGKDHRFTTSVSIQGEVKKGVLKGSIFLYGTGDPTLDLNRLKELASAVAKHGIKKIEGSIFYDTSYFQGPALHSSWELEDLGTLNAPEASSLSIGKNRAVITAKEKEGKVHLTVMNGLPIQVKSNVKVGKKSAVAIQRGRFSNLVQATGTLVKNGSFQKSITLQNPGYFCAYLFKKELERLGIQSKGKIALKKMPQNNITKIAEVYSTGLPHIVAQYLKRSDNFIGQQLVRSISKVNGKSGSASSGIGLISSILKPKTTHPFSIQDGTGLSRKNLISPKSVVDWMRFAMTRPYKASFLSSFAVGGKEGTLVYRFKNALQGRVFAKTGSMKHSHNLAGFLLTKKGRTLLFCVLVNNGIASPKATRDWIDQFVGYLYEHH